MRLPRWMQIAVWSMPIAVWLTGPTIALGAAGEAAQQVREGIGRFTAGEYEAAAKAFAEANVALPDDPRIAFDQACVYAAQGDADQAIAHFQLAATSRDAALVTRSNYNLGCVTAAKAKSLFGAKPEEAPPETREEGLRLLEQAAGYYRDCLQADRDHDGARHNLELLRLWVKHMQEVSAQRDRQAKHKEKNLLELLDMLVAEQQKLRRTAKALRKEAASPQRRQAVHATETAEAKLADEVEPLQAKIDETLRSPPPPATGLGQAGGSGPTGAGVDKAVALLTGLADEAKQSMLHAADRLAAEELAEATLAQTEALDRLNDIYMAVAPFAPLVQKATATEKKLVAESKAIVGEEDDADPANPVEIAADDVDLGESAQTQSLVERWAAVLPLKAERQLKQLESEGPTAAEQPPQQQDPQPGNPQAKVAAEGLKKAMQKALELGPEIERLAGEAAQHLAEQQVPEALPKQEEALRLLEEIAKELPKEEQSQQNKDQEKNEDKNKNDERKQEQKQDENKDQKQGQKPDPKQDEPSDRDKQQSSSEQKKQPGREMSKRQAEAVLSKVRERERHHHELQKQMRAYLQGPVKVDKDW